MKIFIQIFLPNFHKEKCTIIVGYVWIRRLNHANVRPIVYRANLLFLRSLMIVMTVITLAYEGRCLKDQGCTNLHDFVSLVSPVSTPGEIIWLYFIMLFALFAVVELQILVFAFNFSLFVFVPLKTGIYASSNTSLKQTGNSNTNIYIETY